jgi:hypothetical protein
VTDDEIRLQQRARSKVMGILLVAFAVLIFAISIVKIGIAAAS